jgi:RNA polymerase sigma factor (sigma-70 family)
MSATLITPEHDHVADASTAELVRAARANDAHAWNTLVARYSPVINRVVAGFRLPEAEAADVVQATWLCAIEKLESLREPQSFGGWLKTIARRECLHTYHRMGRETPFEPNVLDVAAECPGPECVVIASETHRAVASAVSQLPDRGRRLITMLHHSPELGYRGIAQTLAMPVGSIGPTRQRALHWLRDQLTSAGFGEAVTSW